MYETLLQSSSLGRKITLTLRCAKLDVADGKINEARNEFEYVIKNGNKMDAVRIAQFELSKLSD